MKNIEKFEFDYAGRKLEVEVGRLAAQADSALTVRYGDTTVLVTVVYEKNKRDGYMDFLPLSIEYREKMYASGKISGSKFVKREGKPTDEAILAGRLIDRPVRPLFPKGFYKEIQVIISVLSYDGENDPRIAGLIGTSLALGISEIPWEGPVGIASLGLVDGKFILNPMNGDKEKSEIDLTVVSTTEKVVMIECQANQVPQEKVLEAIEFAHNQMQVLNNFQKDIISKIGKKKLDFVYKKNEEIYKKVFEGYSNEIEGLLAITDKLERNKKEFELIEKMKAEFEDNDEKAEARDYFDQIFHKKVRELVLKENKRIDGRKLNEVREITTEVGVLPRVHGSGLFNRGYTQILNIATLANPSMKLLLDTMEGESERRYMHYYNFPPFSTGETGRLGTGRREIGHGALAEKALIPVLPSEEEFPYTIRLVSEALSSDGSTSMGSTCASTLSLMDAGVPIKAPVSGIAMGIMTEEDGSFKVLTDIAGIEDHFGEMDFKITGTVNGITAIQLDVKNHGLTMEMIKQTFEDGKTGRLHILSKMLETIPAPRKELSPYAPRIEVLNINPEKIKDVIGPGGKMINKIIDETGVEIDIEQDGRVFISSVDPIGMEKAKEIIKGLTEDPEVGKIYHGKVIKIMDFGAFVEIMPGIEGLVHISEIDEKRVENVTDYLQEGQEIDVKLFQIDDMGRLNLSIKRAKPQN
uniref:Polyribonucleotide nucleotidyltransferase n=1 Tax=candidate division CPR3 bacterium TaxID=2268181 RepID=A0A7C4R2J3_UNCC3